MVLWVSRPNVPSSSSSSSYLSLLDVRQARHKCERRYYPQGKALCSFSAWVRFALTFVHVSILTKSCAFYIQRSAIELSSVRCGLTIFGIGSGVWVGYRHCQLSDDESIEDLLTLHAVLYLDYGKLSAQRRVQCSIGH